MLPRIQSTAHLWFLPYESRVQGTWRRVRCRVQDMKSVLLLDHTPIACAFRFYQYTGGLGPAVQYIQASPAAYCAEHLSS